MDYQQLPCRAEDTTQPFTLAGGEELAIEIALPAINVGFHELLLVLLTSPNNHQDDAAFRGESRFLYSFHRTNILVGQATPLPHPPLQKLGEADEMAKQGLNVLSLTQQRAKEAWDPQWHLAEIPVGQTAPYHLWWNNSQPVTETIAVIAFLGTEQVPVTEEHPVLFAALPPHTRADLMGQVTPRQAGSQELVVLLVQTPFLPLGQQEGSDSPLPAFVYSAERVLIKAH